MAAGRTRSAWLWALAALWMVGIVGDAFTTVTMINGGVAVEGNPAAAAVMGVIGIGGWAALASLVCFTFAVGTLGRTRGMFALTWVIAGLVVAAGKAWFAVTNALLWIELAG